MTALRASSTSRGRLRALWAIPPGVHERPWEFGDRIGPEAVDRQVPDPVHHQPGPLQCMSGSGHGYVDGGVLRGHPPDRQRGCVAEDAVGPVHGGEGAGPPLAMRSGRTTTPGCPGTGAPACQRPPRRRCCAGRPPVRRLRYGRPRPGRGGRRGREPRRQAVAADRPCPEQRHTCGRRTRLWTGVVCVRGGFWPQNPPQAHIARRFNPARHPGGCWVHYSHVLVAGYRTLQAGRRSSTRPRGRTGTPTAPCGCGRPAPIRWPRRPPRPVPPTPARSP